MNGAVGIVAVSLGWSVTVTIVIYKCIVDGVGTVAVFINVVVRDIDSTGIDCRIGVIAVACSL